jgi:hypothetical protein
LRLRRHSRISQLAEALTLGRPLAFEGTVDAIFALIGGEYRAAALVLELCAYRPTLGHQTGR